MKDSQEKEIKGNQQRKRKDHQERDIRQPREGKRDRLDNKETER